MQLHWKVCGQLHSGPCGCCARSRMRRLSSIALRSSALGPGNRFPSGYLDVANLLVKRWKSSWSEISWALPSGRRTCQTLDRRQNQSMNHQTLRASECKSCGRKKSRTRNCRVFCFMGHHRPPQSVASRDQQHLAQQHILWCQGLRFVGDAEIDWFGSAVWKIRSLVSEAFLIKLTSRTKLQVGKGHVPNVCEALSFLMISGFAPGYAGRNNVHSYQWTALLSWNRFFQVTSS